MKKDLYVVTLIGLLVGLLVLPVVADVFPGIKLTFSLGLLSVIGFSILSPIALWVVKVISRRYPVFWQFGKFAAVGTLNTFLKLATVNILILMTGVAAGWEYTGFIVIGFFVATTNSYFWNKFWTFQSHAPMGWVEYSRFALFTLGGVILIAGAASLVVNVIGAPRGVSAELWANVGALAGVAVSFLWNFLTYRRIVFRDSSQTLSAKISGENVLH